MASTSAPRRSAKAAVLLNVWPTAPWHRRRRECDGGPPEARRRRPASLDEIWEDIFLRFDVAADLARASATCSSFRRIVSERRFLHRFRSLHSPPVLGFLSSNSYRPFSPVGPPHSSAPEARVLEQAADFTFSFLPDPGSWCFCHACDGRVLLSRLVSIRIRFEDFIVCDPLHRRYVKIPRIPNDLMAFAPGMLHWFPALAPAGENDENESFRVICTAQLKDKVMAFVFSSCNQTWLGIVSTIFLPRGFIRYMTYYAHGCIYWMVGLSHSIMLDISEMKFSIIDLPPHNFDSKVRAIVEAGDGRLGFLTIGDGTIDLYCKNWQRNCVGTQEWLHDKLIPLPKDYGITYHWAIEGTAGLYLALVASDDSSLNVEHFVLDMKTLLVENLCTSKNGMLFGFPYARFPPPLALPSI